MSKIIGDPTGFNRRVPVLSIIIVQHGTFDRCLSFLILMTSNNYFLFHFFKNTMEEEAWLGVRDRFRFSAH